MATSTRANIAARVKARLRVNFRDGRDSDPISLDNIINEVADELSRETRCFQARYTTDITGSVATPVGKYCIPELYEIISTMATLGTDNTATKVLLTQYDINKANHYLPQWRTNPAAGFPRYFIFAPPWIYLYPVPDYTCNSGLTFEGYGSPLTPWAGATDSPPVPERIISTIVYGVAGRWALEFPEEPGMLARAKTNTDRYEELRGTLEAEINRQHDRAREDHHYSG